MIVRAAVVPHPPLLVPELVAGAVAETEPVRAACVAAARALSQAADDWVAVAADWAGPAVVDAAASGTFRGYGVHVPVTLAAATDGAGDDSAADPGLPLPALVAGWLRAQAGAQRVRVRLIAPDLASAACRDLGAQLASLPEPVGLLVLGDGSNRHTERAPAPPDRRAGPFDSRVAAALADADSETLLGLDSRLAAELGAAGRAAWQVLAGAALASGVPWEAEVLYSGSPFGVAYHVAVWAPQRSS